MPSFPIPVFGAVTLAFVAGYLWYTGRRITPLIVLLLCCAAQTLIIALAQHYDVAYMRVVQPVTASLIAPAAWIAFQRSSLRPASWWDMLHLVPPLLALAARLTYPMLLDLLLPAIFVGYGARIVTRALKGADAQPKMLLSSGDWPARIWGLIGALLIGSALSDLLILGTQIAGYPDLRPWIISVFSVGTLLTIGIVSLSPHVQDVQASGEDRPEENRPEDEPDAQLWQRVQDHMREARPYLDPDLTLARFARKLGVPAKTLSVTINRATGENVSRYINAARIEAAQADMLKGHSVTQAMLASGFNTKSNFNREFRRVAGTSPSDWLHSSPSKEGG